MYLYLDMERGWVLIPEPRQIDNSRGMYGCDACGAIVWDTRKHDKNCPARPEANEADVH